MAKLVVLLFGLAALVNADFAIGQAATTDVPDPEPPPIVTEAPFTDTRDSDLSFYDIDDSAEAIRGAEALWEAGDYVGADEFYQHALGLLFEAGDDKAYARLLDSIGQQYAFVQRYADSADYFAQAAEAWRASGSRGRMADSQHFLGVVQQADGDYEAALDSFETALTVRSVYMSGAADTLTRIGNIHFQQARYASALSVSKNALAMWTVLGDEAQRFATLNTIGSIHAQIAQYDQAIRYLNESLTLGRQLDDAKKIATALHNLGFAYSRRGDKAVALRMHQDGLDARRRAGDELGVAFDLNDLGLLYSEMGNHEQALGSLQSALAIFGTGASTNHVRGEGQALDSLGTVHKTHGDRDLALNAYTQALVVQEELPDPAAQRTTYANIAALHDEAGETELATLPAPQQEQYARSVQSVYRRLAELLLEADRVNEARRVLDLLKLQELQDYLQAVTGNDDTIRGVAQTDLENEAIREWINRGTEAIRLGRDLRALRATEANSRSDEDEQRIEQLELLQQQLNRDFNTFLDEFESGQTDSLESLELNSLRDNLRSLDAVLLYPLVLDDRVELILVTSLTAPQRRQVRISRTELQGLVAEFRERLSTPHPDVIDTAQALYRVLFEPLEEQLRAAGSKRILYAPDDFLRYIPIAALHDGDGWIAERFSINNITSTSLIDFDTELPQELTVLAGAFANGLFEIPVDGQPLIFEGLPYAGIEVADIADKIPGATMLTDTDLTRSALIRDMDDHSIVHLATHATFVGGRPEDSFLLLGDGDRITLADMRTWALQKVSMMVLSACETGLGGFGDGREILGFGYLVEKAGIKSAVASLWQIDDGGTQIFMSLLYDRMLQPGVSRLEALTAAQRTMIEIGELPVDGSSRGVGTDVPAAQSAQLGHPHYWAPFILIGNGL